VEATLSEREKGAAVIKVWGYSTTGLNL
jgi:hypothetical protein